MFLKLAGLLLFQVIDVGAVPPRPLAIQPRPNVANAPPAPGGKPNLRDLGSELIQGGIEQFASAAFAPDTSIFATATPPTRTATRSASSNLFGLFPSTTGNAFDISATTTKDAFDIFSTTSDAFDIFAQGTSTSNAFDLGFSTITSGLFPRMPAPTADVTFIPSCPRAELYIDYCAVWYGTDWYTLTVQAYCLCYGPASPSESTDLVWVPDLFDTDARECHSEYVEAIQYWSSIYTGDSDYAFDPRVEAAWNDSLIMEQAWEEAGLFCNTAGNDLNASFVDPTYFEAKGVVTGSTTKAQSPIATKATTSGSSRWQHVTLVTMVVYVSLVIMICP